MAVQATCSTKWTRRLLALGAGQLERWSVPQARGGGPAAERLSAVPVAPLHDIMSFL
jgi:hypothetical protein